MIIYTHIKSISSKFVIQNWITNQLNFELNYPCGKHDTANVALIYSGSIVANKYRDNFRACVSSKSKLAKMDISVTASGNFRSDMVWQIASRATLVPREKWIRSEKQAISSPRRKHVRTEMLSEGPTPRFLLTSFKSRIIGA